MCNTFLHPVKSSHGMEQACKAGRVVSTNHAQNLTRALYNKYGTGLVEIEPASHGTAQSLKKAFLALQGYS